eukprot:5153946-Prymnesium_polylepis.1
MAGETDLALRLFLASHALVPAEPRFVLSAANMMLKLADPEAALLLFDRVHPGLLKPEQAEVYHTKRAAPERRRGVQPSAPPGAPPAPRHTSPAVRRFGAAYGGA